MGSAKVYRVPGFEEASLEDIVAGAGRLLFLGEVHQRDWLVDVHARLLRLLAREGRLGFLAVEWFNIEQQSLLDSWVKGEISWETLVEEYRKGPEGFDLNVYRPILEEARQSSAMIVGVMPPRNVAQRVSRLGETPQLPEGAPDPDRYAGLEEYRSLVSSLFPRQGPMARIPVDRLLRAQSYKDSVAAWRIALEARRSPGAVIMGWVHVEPKGAVATRVGDLLGSREGVLVVGARERLEGLGEWFEEWRWALETSYYIVGTP